MPEHAPASTLDAIRGHLEAICERHLRHAAVHFTPLRARCPVCQDYQDASSALRKFDSLLAEGEVRIVSGQGGTGYDDKYGFEYLWKPPHEPLNPRRYLFVIPVGVDSEEKPDA